jgi:hypothetical protein
MSMLRLVNPPQQRLNHRLEQCYTRVRRGHNMSRHNIQHDVQKKNLTSVVGDTFCMPSAASQVDLMALCPLFILLPLDIRCYTSIFVTVPFICFQ